MTKLEGVPIAPGMVVPMDLTVPYVELPTVRISLGAAVVEDVIYALGGRRPDGSVTTKNEQYTPLEFIPEFSSAIIISMFITATLLAAMAYRRSHQRTAKE